MTPLKSAVLALALLGSTAAFSVPRPLAPALLRSRPTLRNSLLEIEPEPEVPVEDYEKQLGLLVFSSQDPAVDIARDLDFYDDRFVGWLNGKADDCTDLEERTALRSLAEMVVDVRNKVDEKAKALEEEEAAKEAEIQAQRELVDAEPVAKTDEDVLGAMKDVQTKQMETFEAKVDVNAEKKKAEEEAARAKAEEKAKQTYTLLLQQLVNTDEAELVKAVTDNYVRCDYKFLQVAEEQSKAFKAAGQAELSAKIDLVIKAVNEEASKQIAIATEQLQSVLTQPSPAAMESKIMSLAQEGALTDALLLLLEANREQAAAAGVQQAAELMDKLLVRAKNELDRTKSPSQALMRQLIREEDTEERVKILKTAFTPVEKLIQLTPVIGSEKEQDDQPMPEVSPTEFIEAAREMIRTFGNVELTKTESLHDRLNRIIVEAEQVSVSIYGEAMTAREQQDRMWKDGTMSVFDLETLEQQAEVMGETMPWDGEMDETPFIKGFEQGVKKIGG